MGTSCTQNRQWPYPLRNRALLAPMSGVSDVPFRRLAWRFGAGMVVSEMVASEALTTHHAEMLLKAEGAGLPTHVVQLAGKEARWMAEATRMAVANGADAIDINMGCPSKRVTTGWSGSALMRDLDHAVELIRATVAASPVPVTLKMRLGWDRASMNAPELARRAQAEGVQAITVHGRTRDQFYKPSADWNAVRAVRDATTLPLVVNGDIASVADAYSAIRASGADAVMVGRATYGAPWLVGRIGAALDDLPVPVLPRGAAFADFVAEHHGAMVAYYGRVLGVRNARKHLDWYTAHLPQPPSPAARLQLMREDDPDTVQRLCRSLFAEGDPNVEHPREALAA